MQISASCKPAAMLPRQRLPASISVSPSSPRATAILSSAARGLEPFDQRGRARVHAQGRRAAHDSLAFVPARIVGDSVCRRVAAPPPRWRRKQAPCTADRRCRRRCRWQADPPSKPANRARERLQCRGRRRRWPSPGLLEGRRVAQAARPRRPRYAARTASLARLENIERRSRPRIDLQQLEPVSVDEKIRAVQADQRHFRDEPLHGGDHRVRRVGRKRGRLDGAAVAEWLARRRRRPLRAEAENHGAPAVGEEERRDRRAVDAALEIARSAGGVGIDRAPDVPAARAALALDQPAGRIARAGERGLGMRNAAVSAQRRKADRILGARDHVGPVAEQLPALRDAGEQLGPILEAGAADDARGFSYRSQALQRREQRCRRPCRG